MVAPKTQIPSDLEEGVNELRELMKELNLKSVKINLKDTPIFKDSLIVLELSYSDIDTAVQTLSKVE